MTRIRCRGRGAFAAFPAVRLRMERPTRSRRGIARRPSAPRGKGKFFPHLALGFKAYTLVVRCAYTLPSPHWHENIYAQSISPHVRSGQGEPASQCGLFRRLLPEANTSLRTPDGWGSRIFVVTALSLASLPRAGRKGAAAPEPQVVLTTLDLGPDIGDISTSFIIPPRAQRCTPIKLLISR